MKKRLVFCALLGSLTACQHDGDIQPNSLSPASEVSGTYQTNAFADVLCVALQTNQMPSAELKAESDSTATLIYTKRYPTTETRRIEHISLIRQGDVVQLRDNGTVVGSFQTDRVFTNSGMETQGKVLRVTMPANAQNSVSFTGYKQ